MYLSSLCNIKLYTVPVFFTWGFNINIVFLHASSWLLSQRHQCVLWISLLYSAHTPMTPTPPPMSSSFWKRPPVGGATLKRMVREFLYFIDFTVVSLWTAPTTHWRPNNHNKPVRDVNNYLANEGRLYKTANPFGLSRQAMLKIARQVCVVITVHLGPVYIQ